MIETNIGQIVITGNQSARLSTLHDSNILGFFIDSNGIVVKSINPIDQQAVLASILALDNSPLSHDADKSEFATSVFKNLTPQQADDYIVANVTDLASAKLVMRRMIRVLLYLVRRSDL